MEDLALSSLLGAAVYDNAGALAGHVREVAVAPREDPNRISDFIVKTREGDRLMPARQVKAVLGSTIQVTGSPQDWPPLVSSEGMLLLERDLLDQQIIDVSGRKVVRVNDVDLRREPVNGTVKLKLGRVDIGLRGAIRRLLKGLAPSRAIEALAAGFTRFEMGATLTGVKLFRERGYVALERLDLPLEKGVTLPIVHMVKQARR